MKLIRKIYILLCIIIYILYTIIDKYPFKSELHFYAILGGLFGFSVLLFLVIYSHYYGKK